MGFHLMCVHINFSLLSVAEWPPFGKELPCSLCIFTICKLSFIISSFGIEGGIWVLIAPVHGLCILVTCVIFNLAFPWPIR